MQYLKAEQVRSLAALVSEPVYARVGIWCDVNHGTTTVQVITPGRPNGSLVPTGCGVVVDRSDSPYSETWYDLAESGGLTELTAHEADDRLRQHHELTRKNQDWIRQHSDDEWRQHVEKIEELRLRTDLRCGSCAEDEDQEGDG